MLDLLQTIKDEGGTGIPVKAESPQFRQHPCVGGVPAINRQLDVPAYGVVPGEFLHPPDLAGCPGDALDRDIQVPSNANSSPRRTEKVTPRTASKPRPPGPP